LIVRRPIVTGDGHGRNLMKRFYFALFALLSATAALAQKSQLARPQVVEVPSGKLRLKGYLWKPEGRGHFPAVVFNHGRSSTARQHGDNLTLTEAANILGPVFAKHGYIFLFPFRRGEGPSADQGPFIGDLLQREETEKGKEARNRLQMTLATSDHLDD